MVQSLDILTLGPINFVDYSTPEQMPSSGAHRAAKHKLLGGSNVVDMLGADPDDRSWSGFFFSADALGRALLLDSCRVAGQPLPLSWGAESRTVVISKFGYRVEKFNYVHYDITCMITDNLEAATSTDDSPDSTIGDDLDSAQSASSGGGSATPNPNAEGAGLD